MTGYSWSAPAVDMGAVTVNGPEGQAPSQDAIRWDSIDWRGCEDRVRRLRQRIFKAAREQDWPKVRNLQKLMLRSRAAQPPSEQAAAAVTELGRAGITVGEFALGQPSLDEVFLALTSQPTARSAPAAAGAGTTAAGPPATTKESS